MEFKKIFNNYSKLKEPKSLETCAFEESDQYANVLYAKKQKNGLYRIQSERMRRRRIYLPPLLECKIMYCFSPIVQETDLTLSQAVQKLHQWEKSQDASKRVEEIEEKHLSMKGANNDKEAELGLSGSTMEHYSYCAKKFDIQLQDTEFQPRTVRKFKK